MNTIYRFGEVGITNLVLFSRKGKIETQMSLRNKRHQFLGSGLLHQVSQAWHFAIGFKWISPILTEELALQI